MVASQSPTAQVARKLNVEVNGISVGCGADSRILDSLQNAGFDVPTLCFDERSGPQGTCRLCLVDVEVDGQTQQLAACTALVSDGMRVETHSAGINEYRKTILELLLSETSSPANCPKCISFKKCELHAAAEEYGAKWDAFPSLVPREKAETTIRSSNEITIIASRASVARTYATTGSKQARSQSRAVDRTTRSLRSSITSFSNHPARSAASASTHALPERSPTKR